MEYSCHIVLFSNTNKHTANRNKSHKHTSKWKKARPRRTRTIGLHIRKTQDQANINDCDRTKGLQPFGRREKQPLGGFLGVADVLFLEVGGGYTILLSKW